MPEVAMSEKRKHRPLIAGKGKTAEIEVEAPHYLFNRPNTILS